MINKDTLNIIRNQIDPLLAELNKVNKQFNLKLGNCTYNADTATFKMEVRSVEEGGEIVTKDLSDLRSIVRHGFDGLKEEHLTKEFKTSKGTARLCGYRGRANKSFVFEVLDGVNKGKKFVTDTKGIQFYLGIEAPSIQKATAWEKMDAICKS
jgi:hypothetical protein